MFSSPDPYMFTIGKIVSSPLFLYLSEGAFFFFLSLASGAGWCEDERTLFLDSLFYNHVPPLPLGRTRIARPSLCLAAAAGSVPAGFLSGRTNPCTLPLLQDLAPLTVYFSLAQISSFFFLFSDEEPLLRVRAVAPSP